MRIMVLDPDGKALPGVNIFASASDTKSVSNHDYTTNAEGKATVELPQKIDLLRIWGMKNGYVGLFAQWWRDHQPDGHLIPVGTPCSGQHRAGALPQALRDAATFVGHLQSFCKHSHSRLRQFS
jgi:hypothetical protein